MMQRAGLRNQTFGNLWTAARRLESAASGFSPRVEIAYTSHCVSLHHVLQYNVVHLAMTQIAFCTCWDSCRFQADTCRVLGRWTLTELVFSDTCKPKKKKLVAGFRQRHWWTKIPSLVYFWPGKCFFRSGEPAWRHGLTYSAYLFPWAEGVASKSELSLTTSSKRQVEIHFRGINMI